MRTPLVIANWKMHGSHDLCREFMTGLQTPSSVDVWIAPPALYLQALASSREASIGVGAQDVHFEDDGAYTGEISAGMVGDLGGTFAIVGHSERRSMFHETDRIVAQKFLACCEAGLTPVLCVGETLEQRESGIAKDVVWNQVAEVLKECESSIIGRAQIAYEPVWAIGTGVVATPEDAEDMHHHLRSMIADSARVTGEELRILYGGSVKVDNASQLISQANVDGFLVGGASLDVDQFNAICSIASGN